MFFTVRRTQSKKLLCAAHSKRLIYCMLHPVRSIHLYVCKLRAIAAAMHTMQLCAPKSIVSVSVPDEQFIPLRLIRGRKNEAPAWRLKHDWLVQITKAKISSNVVLGLP